MDIVFVILHYIATEETIECINYIRKNVDTTNFHIVIVDNASPNDSGKLLKERFKFDGKVTVLINEENLGFSRGNNIGFRYAKKFFSPNYIVLLNNDVFLYEKQLLMKLDSEYAESDFYVLGPLIMTRDGRCNINPDNAIFNCVADIDKMIKRFKKFYFRYKYHYANLLFWVSNIIGAIKGKKIISNNKEYLKRAENVKLHGCFLAFSSNYIEEFDGLDESTYLYWEEEFLYKHMTSLNKTTVYNPSIMVFHKEDASTNAIDIGERKRKMFLYENYVNSLEKLKDLYIYYENREKEGE